MDEVVTDSRKLNLKSMLFMGGDPALYGLPKMIAKILLGRVCR